MKKFILLTILAVLALSSVADAAMTYGAAYYRERISMVGDASSTDPLYLFINEVETTIDGTSGVTNIIFTPGTAPAATEGTLYYDSVAKGLVLRTDSAWVDVDVSGASSLDTAYNAGAGITVDGDAVTLTTGAAVNNSALSIVHGESTNDNDAVVITNAADAGTAVTIQIDGTAGYDIQGTGDVWQVSIAGVAGLVGANVGNSDLVFTEPTTNDVTLLADGDGILTISAGSMEDIDINLATANTLTLTSSTAVDAVNWGALDSHTSLSALAFDAAAGSITLTADAGTEDLTISQAGAVDASLILTSEGTGTDALSLLTTNAAGDIKVASTDNIDIDAADNITVDTADGSYILTTGGATNGDFTLSIADKIDIDAANGMAVDVAGASGQDYILTNTGGSIAIVATEAAADVILIQATAAGGDVNIDSVLGRIEIEAEEDAANAILITADGGVSSTLRLHNDTGTGATSIDILTDVGGITNTASAGAIVMTATGGTVGDITLSAGDIMTLTSVDTKIFDGAAAETWIVEGTADDHEASIVFTDPTADVVYTFPVAAASTLSVMTSTLATNAPDIANSVTGGTSTLIFEGAAVDAHEHTVTATDPTADIVWTLPDAGAQTVSFMSSTLATNMPEVVNSVTGGTATLIFEGTADGFETTLGAVDATADVTLTLADDTGGIAYIPPASTTKDASDAAIPLTHAVVIGTSGGASAWSLPDGNPGQVLTVVIGTDGGEATITPASLTGCGWATVVLTSDIDGVTFMFVDATVGWVILGTFSDGTNLVAVTQ